ncbi:MAG: ATP synthase F1 subunit epsilon [Coriobacteriales bacterium]|jgi:F-type H+-transporting ATPase subunit epsilon|nr:ATP synthase F1 subunit epsilon [Coriobacteriales bacterium]
MANTLNCDIVTPDSMLFSGKAVLVSAPAAEGDIGLMYQCSPLMSTLRRGVIRIKNENDEVTTFAANGGYLEVDGHKVIVLASRAINVDEIDTAACKESISANEKRNAELEEGNPAKAYAISEISWLNYLLTLK